MEIFKSNGPICSFYPNLSQNFLYTQIVQGVPFKYLKWKNSIQMDKGAFVNIINEKMIMKKFLSYVTGKFYFH